MSRHENEPEVRPPIEQVCAHLLDRNILTAGDVMDGEVELTASERQRSTTVTASVGGSISCIAKLAHPGEHRWCHREIACLRFVDRLEPRAPDPRSSPSAAGYGPSALAPRLLTSDRERAFFVLAAVPRACTLHDVVSRRGLSEPARFGALASLLARVHRGDDRDGGTSRFSDRSAQDEDELSRELPWILLTQDNGGGRRGSDAEHMWSMFDTAARTQPLARRVVQARDLWRPISLIHGDVKWDNVLLGDTALADPTAMPSGAEAPLLVDWELGGTGDPLWDVGTVVQELLLSDGADERWSQDLSATAHPRFMTRPASRCVGEFLHRYRESAEPRPPLPSNWLQRTALFAGVRLLQSTFELVTVESGLGPQAVSALQLAERVCEAPDRLADELKLALADARSA